MASLFSSVLFTLSLLSSSPFLSNANANANAHTKLGFSADLIHRDSPKSPFHNPTETSAQRVRKAVHRSVNRFVHFNGKDASLTLPQSVITSDSFEYLMNISLGTPPFPIMAIADTGSDLLWTQCKPCNNCYAQDDPIFDPQASSTYKSVGCYFPQCTVLGYRATCSITEDDETCSYTVSYGDKSYTKGNVAVDTLTLGSTDNVPVHLQKIIIGCGHDNGGVFSRKSSGIVGLGGGPVSLISQLGEAIAGKFSYCLVPLSSKDKTSKINFGSNAVVWGNGAVSTPSFKKGQETFYYLNLQFVSVGSTKFEVPGATDVETDKGNIIIDSGTVLTTLPTEFYSKFEDAVASSINAPNITSSDSMLHLCYMTTADKLNVPVITMHFDGADVKLDSSNVFVQISKDLVCFAFRGDDQVSIYGSIAQMNFLVGYDTVYQTVSFMPADCANM